METINGEWYMKGCSSNDPGCIHTIDELICLIHEIGFLPLFSNEIRGFSVEERTVPHHWWTDNVEKDPWAWRQILSRNPDIVYGKFFDKKAGFISKEWFPAFANYRRNGYDFDALVGDELVPYRNQKLMEALELDEQMNSLELMSFEIKAKAGFGKNGQKNFEGVLTELQMQTYLIMKDFQQKKNKKGQEYGWHIAVFSTPETKWGYDYVATGYETDPKESWERIKEQVKRFYPHASDKDVEKLLGIQYPGENKVKKVKPPKARQPKEWVIPANPKFFDIVHAFDHAEEIDWKQGSGIIVGDTVYMYVGSPISAIMYKCVVTETNIPFDYADENLTIKALMKIKLLKRYDPDQYTFTILKEEYGINAIRGPRGIPESLSKVL